jgi:acyl-CoA thioesterase-1
MASGTAKDSNAAPPATRPELLLIGTSLTAGYGLDPSQAWSAQLQQRIDAAGLPFAIRNAGVSGESSADALHRLDWLLGASHPALIMVETGANDALRGQSVDSVAANLDAILTRLDQLQPRPVVVVAGMEALPNLGRQYGDRFRAVFVTAARAHRDVYLPFLLAGVAGVDSLNQGDGIHPNAHGSVLVADNVWRTLHPLLDSLQHTHP